MNEFFFSLCRRSAWLLVFLLVAAMAVATFAEQMEGRPFAVENVYHAPWFALMWLFMAVFGALWLVRFRRPAHVWLLHSALLIILLGAAVSFGTSRSGTLHLRMGFPTHLYADEEMEGRVGHLPFTVGLDTFRVEHYEGTTDASDYVAGLTVFSADGAGKKEVLSMNNVLHRQGVCLFLKSYDTDCRGVVLGVRIDDFGMGISYVGYLLLFVALLWTLLTPKGSFRRLLDERSKTELSAHRIEHKRGGLFRIFPAVWLVWLTMELWQRYLLRGRLPLTDGYETMLAIAWLSAFVPLLARKRLTAGIGSLLAAVCAVAVMLLRPEATTMGTLPPVLNSPLLEVHVSFVIVGYMLFAFTFFCALVALLGRLLAPQRRGLLQRLARLSLMAHYPALACLCVGIFLGAVWAGSSWGRLWGWDAKETWALITMLLYALPLHRRSLPWLRRPVAYHAYMLLAFLSLLMTYFGVNFWFTGLHSYAG